MSLLDLLSWKWASKSLFLCWGHYLLTYHFIHTTINQLYSWRWKLYVMISRIYTIKVHFYFSMPRYSDTLFQPPEGEDDFCQNKMWTSFWHVIADVFYSLYLQRGGKTRDAILKKMLFHFKNWTSWNVKYSIDPLEHQSGHHLHAYIIWHYEKTKKSQFWIQFFCKLV